MDTITIRRPDDFHVHFRQGDLLEPMEQATASSFCSGGRSMPNTDLPIVSVDDINRYRQEILAASPGGLRADHDLQDSASDYGRADLGRFIIRLGLPASSTPKEVTTNSEGGVRDFRSLWPVFGAMQHTGLILCLHGETPDDFCLDREEKFLEVLAGILQDFPRLKVVLEHLSTYCRRRLRGQLPR